MGYRKYVATVALISGKMDVDMVKPKPWLGASQPVRNKLGRVPPATGGRRLPVATRDLPLTQRTSTRPG